MDMGLREALNLAWHFLTKDAHKKGIDKLKADLIKPLPGQSQEVSEGLVQAEKDMFTKMYASFGNKTK